MRAEANVYLVQKVLFY